MNRRKKLLVALAAVSAGVLIVEFGLRIGLGLGDPPLMYTDTEIGYAYLPGQVKRRFGREIRYSDQGLRSENLRPVAKGMPHRILCIGDSVTNGGAPTDQSETYPYLLEKLLEKSGRRVQVLNASAGGWAVANELGFLKRRGLFGARLVVVQIGTHDLTQEKSPATLVGQDPRFPDRKPAGAIWELVERYLLIRFAPPSLPSAHHEPTRAEGLKLLPEMFLLIEQGGGQGVVLFTPDRAESKSGVRVDSRVNELRAICRRSGVVLVDGLPRFHEITNKGETLFRDEIHPNERGNGLMAELVAGACERMLMP